jgi:4-aminobutyrate--pyruvate transaminase
LEQGLIVRAIRDAVAVCPPLIITADQVDELFDKFGRALDVSLQQARARGLQIAD